MKQKHAREAARGLSQHLATITALPAPGTTRPRRRLRSRPACGREGEGRGEWDAFLTQQKDVLPRR